MDKIWRGGANLQGLAAEAEVSSLVIETAGFRSRTPRPTRYSAHNRPTMIWYRTDVPSLKMSESADKKCKRYIAARALRMHNPVLGILGIPPPKLKYHLRALGHSKRSTNKRSIKKINGMLLTAAIKMYRRYDSRRYDNARNSTRAHLEGVT